jgi:GxxExxY protein
MATGRSRCPPGIRTPILARHFGEVHRGLRLDAGYRIDLRVEKQVVVELKSVNAILRVHEAQLLSYLKLIACEVGLLINFNVVNLRDGIICRVL